MKKHSRRDFLKALTAISAGTLVAPIALANSRDIVTQSSTAIEGAERSILDQWKFSGSHWGAFRARVIGDRVTEVVPFEFDKFPSDLIYNIPGIIYNSSREEL